MTKENCEGNFLSQINYLCDKGDKYDEYTTIVWPSSPAPGSWSAGCQGRSKRAAGAVQRVDSAIFRISH